MLGVVVLFGGVRASTCPLAPKLFHRRATESAGVSDEGRCVGESDRLRRVELGMASP